MKQFQTKSNKKADLIYNINEFGRNENDVFVFESKDDDEENFHMLDITHEEKKEIKETEKL